MDISRHKSLFDPYYFNKPVHVVGAGSTGSWLVMMLAKLGITDITVYDFDRIEEHNIANQMYGIQDIGKFKVDALQEQVLHTCGTKIKAKNMKVKGDTKLFGYVFMMVDTMTSRKKLWECSIKRKTSVDLLVEPRMGLSSCRIYNVIPTNRTHIEIYEENFYTDEEATVSACGMSQSVITTATNVASMCVRQLINHNKGEELDNEIMMDYINNNLITSKWR